MSLAGSWVNARLRAASSTTPGRRIEEYDFYPFRTNEAGQVEFDIDLFNKAVSYLLENRDPLAGQQLIIIGEQNLVRNVLYTEQLVNYKKLYDKYDGQSVISDNAEYLENYKRIVQLIGKSFTDVGFEILLHNLVNPAKSVIAIENGEVTGRRIENGTTNLVLDLKTRAMYNQDKLNYSLTIGSRKFKCTTIPIFRRDYGLVGAVCINVDSNFLTEEVLSSHKKMVAFIERFVKTDMELDENILSPAEYQKALDGKRHFLDDGLFQEAKPVERKRQLVAIMFSDIVGFSRVMGENEQKAMDIVHTNRKLHFDAIARHNGELLKEMGDGMLASFHSAMDAVMCSRELIRETAEVGTYQLRIGVHLGEVMRVEGDVFGDGVNIAARIQASADDGRICISGEVYNNVKNKLEADFEPLGEVQLKNIGHAVHLYQLKERVDSPSI